MHDHLIYFHTVYHCPCPIAVFLIVLLFFFWLSTCLSVLKKPVCVSELVGSISFVHLLSYIGFHLHLFPPPSFSYKEMLLLVDPSPSNFVCAWCVRSHRHLHLIPLFSSMTITASTYNSVLFFCTGHPLSTVWFRLVSFLSFAPS